MLFCPATVLLGCFARWSPTVCSSEFPLWPTQHFFSKVCRWPAFQTVWSSSFHPNSSSELLSISLNLLLFNSTSSRSIPFPSSHSANLLGWPTPSRPDPPSSIRRSCRPRELLSALRCSKMVLGSRVLRSRRMAPTAWTSGASRRTKSRGLRATTVVITSSSHPRDRLLGWSRLLAGPQCPGPQPHPLPLLESAIHRSHSLLQNP